MNQFAKMLQERSFVLMVSLVENTIENAEAARDGGADCVKVHTSVTHDASGRSFGPLDDYRDVFSTMIGTLRIPVGIVPGAGLNMTSEEIRTMKELGFLFIDNFASNFSTDILRVESIGKMCAVTRMHSAEAVTELSSLPFDAVEADIVPHDGYGQRLSVDDLVALKLVAKASRKPVIVPSQRLLVPGDIPALIKCGVKGVMIGVVATGYTTEGIRDAAMQFRKAIDDALAALEVR
ncbi:MAG: hypothetical protein VB144_13535 [Clostridia bacterium]|nr:hypothetical protein [Clostridia bacterium]